MTEMIRRFNDDAVQLAIDAALANVPEDSKGAVVAYVDADGSARFAVAGRIGPNWSLVGLLDKQPGMKPEGGAAVRFVW